MGKTVSRRSVLAGASMAGVMATMPAFAKPGPGGFSPEGLKAVTAAMLGHVRGKAVLVGTFKRSAP